MISETRTALRKASHDASCGSDGKSPARAAAPHAWVLLFALACISLFLSSCDRTSENGPPLLHVGTRTYLAGFISNSPENMALWIENPQKALPGNAMPRMGLAPQEARDIAAFLYTLK
jgi:cytochrome c1